MRKRLIIPVIQNKPLPHQDWMDLETLAQVEISSEGALHPIEFALTPDIEHSWKAARPGKQTIRLIFDEPQKIQHIRLQFWEDEQARTHEFLLRYYSDREMSYKDIVRQQYNFSPPHTSDEIENYTVKLEDVTELELIINPDISGGSAKASLAGLQLA